MNQHISDGSQQAFGFSRAGGLAASKKTMTFFLFQNYCRAAFLFISIQNKWIPLYFSRDLLGDAHCSN